MEGSGIFKKNPLSISHLPTVALLLGYIIYWLELYFLSPNAGRTSIFATVVFLATAISVIVIQRGQVLSFLSYFKKGWASQKQFTKICLFTGFLIVLGIGIVAIYAALLPPHSSQEFDALNYHLTLPRQHLILNSFKHIQWSSADLFPLPIDFALAPYWFATRLPNKLPQFFFLLGLVAVVTSLVKRLSSGNFVAMCLGIFAIFGSHFIGIQMGTAMLDIVLCYLFFAALDSFLKGNIFLSTLEFTFFFWAKSFIPFQLLSILLMLGILFVILKRSGFKDIRWDFKNQISPEIKQVYYRYSKKFVVLFILFSIVIAGPFLVKSTYYSETPLFPFFPGILNVNKDIDKNSQHWAEILSSSKSHIRAKDSYGYGRGVKDFIKHFWLIAVPDEGVNNKYDYPVGLIYLLFFAPFMYMLFSALAKKQFAILPIFTVIYWVSWWFGSQQTRFLYIPVLLIVVTVLAEEKFQSEAFILTILFSLMITGISVFRANKDDFGLSKIEVLREKDKKIIRMNEIYLKINGKGKVKLPYYDVAFAQFPVTVTKEKLPWVLPIETDSKK